MLGGIKMDEAQEVFQDTVEKVYVLSDRVNENTLKYIGAGVAIFFLCLVLRAVLTKYILKLLTSIIPKSKMEIDKKIMEAFQKPMKAFFIVLGIYFIIIFFGNAFLYDLSKNMFIKHLFSSLVIILAAWGCYNLTTEHSLLYEELFNNINFKVDKIVFPFLAKIIRFTIVALTISVVLSEWGYNVNGFVAGLGIGGLAFAFAAKDSLANIFGGLVIVVDKPFSIGDYIKTPNVEGVVEDINFRSTKIRALDKGLVTEPNSILSNSTIVNWTKRDIRRLNFIIGVTYGTTKEQIQNCVKKIRDMLIKDENILEDGILVSFDKFGPSSLDITINCIANTADLNKFMEIKENINFKVMDILESEGVSMAFPSTSVYFQTPLIK